MNKLLRKPRSLPYLVPGHANLGRTQEAKKKHVAERLRDEKEGERSKTKEGVPVGWQVSGVTAGKANTANRK